MVIGGTANQVGDSSGSGVLDPLLGPLADNGGPTQTHALLPGSPAIDAASPLFDLIAIPLDQRGAPFDRASGTRVDIGAYERQTVAGLSLVVDEVSDVYDGDTSPGSLSLREAIGLANGSVGPDTITFGAPFNFSQTLTLLDQLPTITDPLTIDGPGQALLTLDAGNGEDGQFATLDGFRHFDLDDGLASRINVTLNGLTLTGGDLPFVPGDPVLDGVGGAIRSRENLNLNDVTLTANAATEGGAISSRTGGLEVTRSTISDNRATAFPGGGIHHDGVDLIVSESTISGNSTRGDFAPGGGIYTRQPLELNQSTISGNATTGEGSPGGGVFAAQGFDITQSTIVLNETLDSQSPGGGLYQSGGQTSLLRGSILSRNRNGSGNGNDFAVGPGQFALTANFSLIGSDVMRTAGSNNFGSDNPELGPLALNGGPTRTHQPLPGSPAVDQGNPAITSGSDQRGAPFDRVFSRRVDIGAVERQPGTQLPGDYNDDGTVDAADYTVWRDNFGQIVTLPNEDPGVTPGQVTLEDRDVWRDNYGTTRPATVAVASAITAEPPLRQPAFVEPEPEVDVALATLFTPSTPATALPSSTEQPAASAAASTDHALLLLALATAEADSGVSPEFAPLDDAVPEEGAPEDEPAMILP